MTPAIQEFDSYRDGGTIKATLVDGATLYVDRRIGTTTRDCLFGEYPTQASTPLRDDEGEIIRHILTCHAEWLDYTKAHSAVYSTLTSEQEHNAHRAARLTYGQLVALRNAI